MSMPVILIFYLIALLVVLGSGVGVYWVFARRNRLLGAALGLLLVAVLVLLWPIPIHGGFTFLGEVLYSELENQMKARVEEKQATKRQEFVAQTTNRFHGRPGFSVVERLADDWYRVQTGDGVDAWYDAGTRLLWSEWLPLDSNEPLPPLERAKVRCQEHPPTGDWALASEVENYLLWKSDGRNLLPQAPGSSMSYLVADDLGMELPTYALRKQPAPAGGHATVPTGFAVRCIALGADAPAGGYARRDIPLNDWNRYQLSKSVN